MKLGESTNTSQIFSVGQSNLAVSCALGVGSEQRQCNSPALTQTTEVPQPQIRSVLSQPPF